MSILYFAVLFLFAAVIVLGFGFFVLARQIGVLFERIAPMGALMDESGPKIGENAPRLTLESLTGNPIIMGEPSAKATLLFFLSPTCPVCKKMLPILRAMANTEKKWLALVLASDGEVDKHRRFIEHAGLADFPYVLSTELGLAFRVARLPFAVLIDANGKVQAKGLVNSREHLESLFNAHEAGVSSIQQFIEARHG